MSRLSDVKNGTDVLRQEVGGQQEGGRSMDLEIITIYEISKLLTASLDFAKSVRGVLNVLQSYLHMDGATLRMAHEPERVHVAGVEMASGLAPLIPDGAAVSAIQRTGMPLAISDIAQHPLFAPDDSVDLRSFAGVAYLGVPIKEGRDCVGVLSVQRRPGSARRISFERDLRILTLVANLIGQTHKLHQSLAAERKLLIEEQQRLQKRLRGDDYDIENIVGKSRRIKDVFADARQAAGGTATVLLRGESGTGKEAIAVAIHYLSPRVKGPFVKVNCAALPETLLESELFGHEKGAFTGATAERRGRFEMADGGTLFLDEIGDISPSFQAKLLRVLQEHEFERVGGNKTRRTNFRLVAATNRNLEEMVAKSEFRGDLYFRINVVSIVLPPLRERKEDIPLLVDFFLERFNRENARRLSVTPSVMAIFLNCNWPGNVRELENCVERTATMCRGNVIQDVDMLCQRGQCFSSVLFAESAHANTFPLTMHARPRATEAPSLVAESERTPSGADEPMSERDRLVDAMQKCGWVQAKAARMLSLTPRQMGYALKKYNIDVKRF